jgi:putative DNA primase/helicase
MLRSVEREWQDIALTDTGNAQRFVVYHGHEARYVHAWKRWLVWEGRRWAADDSGAAVQMTKDTAQGIYHDAANVCDPEQAKELGRHASRSLSRERRLAMLALAQSEPGVPLSADQLDQDPWLLNVANGTLDLRTGVLRDHDPADLITKLAPVEYRSYADRPIWDAFLDRITGGSRELAGYLQRSVGYSLTGMTSERALFVLHGVGRNGKSTFVEAVHAILGDYATVASVEMLMAKQYGGGIPNDVAALKGARFVSASEAEQGRRLAEAQIKRLTGGDTVTARFLYGEPFTFRPQFKLWLATNHKPDIRGTDKGIWDRIRLVPFTVRIPEDEVDRELAHKLRGELPGILAWAMEGCLEWQRQRRLSEPPAVVAATAGYQQEMDVLAAFIEDQCDESRAATVTVKALYAAYVEWCKENGEYAVKSSQLSRQLRERGLLEPKHARAGNYWAGIGLREAREAGEAVSGFSPPLFTTGLTNPKEGSPSSPGSHVQSPDGLSLVEGAA